MAFDIAGARKSGYSDAEIADYLASQNRFDAQGARGAGYSDADIISHLGGSGTSTTADVAKQVGAGLVTGVESIPAAPAALANLAAGPAERAGAALGVTSPEAEQQRKDLKSLIDKNRGGGVSQYLPEPQTTAGQYARTAAEFVPSSLAMPGGVATNAAIGAASGLASEGAGQLVEKYAPQYETAARIVAPILAGGVAAAGPNTLARRAASAGVPEVSDLRAAGDNAYKAVKDLGVTLDPTAVSSGLGEIRQALKQKFGNPEKAVPITDDLLASEQSARAPLPQRPAADPRPQPPAKAPVTTDELNELRKQLGAVATGPNATERYAAQIAQDKLDNLLANIAPEHVVTGDAKAAADLFKEARANWAAMKRTESVQGRVELGDLNSDSSAAGGNINTGRQAIKSMIRPNIKGETPAKKMGFDEAERKQMRRIVSGDMAENTLRLLGGSGLIPGVAQASGVGAAYATGDPSYLLTIPAMYAARRMAGGLTKRQERILDEMVRSRSPAGQAFQITAPPQRLTTGTTGALMGLQAGRNLLLDDENQPGTDLRFDFSR